ncbi:tetratricopeptide repeat protein [Pseudomonas fluorescens]|uniref:Tetratricopeptide repeat protein n=1 Tax=Pseudomonas fluorescens TaxID=294 RepID=A0A125QD14_PSEFL|nr:hypothetical protein [Pseudomonas fluorescens]KWV70483.1 Tetratricopeptide repeat protein [Pseudomonas fluorescens]
MLESLEKMLAKGVDNSLLRFGLGKGYLDLKDNTKAAEHLQRCVEFDPKYSAAWKLLGKAQLGQGDNAGARHAWEKGIEAVAGREKVELLFEVNRLSISYGPCNGIA